MLSKRLVILPHRNCASGRNLSLRGLARSGSLFPWGGNPPRCQKQQTGLGDRSKQANPNETSGKVSHHGEPSQTSPEAPRIFPRYNWSSKDPHDKTRPQANSGEPQAQQYPPILVLYLGGISNEVLQEIGNT